MNEVLKGISLHNCVVFQVRLTIWGNAAENFDGTQQPVLAVKGAKLSDFNGRSLSLLSSSTLQVGFSALLNIYDV